MEDPARIGDASAKVTRLRLGLKVVALGLVLAAVLFSFGFFLFWNLIDFNADPGRARADAIVALTGGEARIPEAVKLLSQGRGRRLLISGVNPSTTRGELAGLTPGNLHLFRCCVDLGREARDTIGNADETSEWVRQRQFKSLIVVTANYHMPRSLAELRRTLPDVALIAYPVQPSNLYLEDWWEHPGTMRLLLTEYVKFVPALGRCMLARIRHGTWPLASARQCLNGAGPL